MDETHTRQFFCEPKQTFQRQYEALRAIFLEHKPFDQVAKQFSYKPSALRSMASRFRADCRRGVIPPFFSPTDADVPSGKPPAKTDHAPNCPKPPTAGS